MTSDNIKSAITQAFQQTNNDILGSNYDCNLSGSTCISVLLDFNNKKIYSANLGDSRAILGNFLKINEKNVRILIIF